MSLRMGMSSAVECHLCVLANNLRRDIKMAPSHLLRRHAEKKFDLYRPRVRDEVLNAAPVDLVGTPLSAEEARQMWTLRRILDRARHEKDAHERVFASLEARGSDESLASEAWIRLLVLEPYWLHSEPLDGEEARNILAKKCLVVLRGGIGLTSTEAISWQAIMALRECSKRIFTAEFPMLIRTLAAHETLSAELCFGMHVLLERPYHHHPSPLGAMSTALLEARDNLLERRRESALPKQLLHCVSTLHRRSAELQTRLGIAGDTRAAWSALQTRYVLDMNTHAGALQAMLQVLAAVSGPAAESRAIRATPEKPDGQYWAEVASAWSVCQNFLAAAVFPYLELLQDILESGAIRSQGATYRELLAFSPARADTLAEQLYALESKPELFDEQFRRLLAVESMEWFENLLRAPEEGGEGRRWSHGSGSVLLRLLGQNPTNLNSAWREALDRSIASGLSVVEVDGATLQEVAVYCRRSLLVDAFCQIIENAAGKHHAASGRPAEGCRLKVDAVLTDDRVALRILNNWSSTERVTQGGAEFFSDELAFFGCILRHGPKGDQSDPRDWTYEVTMILSIFNADEESGQ
jgi:hypothetical protein